MSSASRTLRRMGKIQMMPILSGIGKILRERWDPIGVNTFPEALDEYDSYAPGVYSLLLQGATDTEIAGHLRRIEMENMGLSSRSSNKQLASVVAALRDIDLNLP